MTILVTVLISFQFASPVVAVEDTTPPTINWVAFDRPFANVDETVNIQLSASDDISGLDYGWAHLYDIAHNFVNAFSLQYNSTTGYLEGSFVVNQYWLPQVYFGFVEAYDLAGNWVYESNGTTTYISPVLDLIGTTPDTTAPTLNWVSFDRSLANNGDVVGISVSASDDISGVLEGWTHLYTPDHTWLTAIYLYPNVTTGNLEGEFMVNTYWPSSIYIGDVELRDFAGNWVIYYNGTDFVAPVIDFIGTAYDNTPPVLNWVSFDRTEVVPGDLVRIEAKATDDIAGTLEGWAHIYDRNKDYTTAVYLNYNTSTSLLEGTLNTNEYWAYPLYIGNMETRDNANNWDYLYNGTDYFSPVLYSTTAPVPVDLGLYTNISDGFTYSGAFDILVGMNRPGTGEVFIDGSLTNTLLIENSASFWLNTSNYFDGIHFIDINVYAYDGNSTSLTFEVKFDNAIVTPPPQEIHVSVDPINMNSKVNETVRFDFKVESTFVHDMPDVKLQLKGKINGVEQIFYENSFFLSHNSFYTSFVNVVFTEVGVYDLEAVLFDDIGVSWSFFFSWEVFPADSTSDTITPITSDNSTLSNDTSPDAPPALDLPGFTLIYSIVSFGIAMLVIKKKRN